MRAHWHADCLAHYRRRVRGPRNACRWDSLSLVRRRTPAIKAEIVTDTENAFLMVVDAHTTAASNTQLSVEKEMNDEKQDEGD